jgi:hypothetical protein
MTPRVLTAAARDYLDRTGRVAISVWCVPGLNWEETAAAAASSGARFSNVSESTVGAIREAGFEVIPGPGTGHCQLVPLSRSNVLPSDTEWARLLRVFGPRQRVR